MHFHLLFPFLCKLILESLPIRPFPGLQNSACHHFPLKGFLLQLARQTHPFLFSTSRWHGAAGPLRDKKNFLEEDPLKDRQTRGSGQGIRTEGTMCSKVRKAEKALKI